jgi:hypothetical protein
MSHSRAIQTHIIHGFQKERLAFWSIDARALRFVTGAFDFPILPQGSIVDLLGRNARGFHPFDDVVETIELSQHTRRLGRAKNDLGAGGIVPELFFGRPELARPTEFRRWLVCERMGKACLRRE